MNQKLARMIDHTLLKPDATIGQIHVLCEEAKSYRFASVCVNPYWVKAATEKLKATCVKVCTVVGFPLGATTQQVKIFETRNAVKNGADEIDMVMNIGAFKSREWEVVKQDMDAVVEAAQGRIVKVILETFLLNEEEIVQACRVAEEAGAHFIKTSTGFDGGGATVETVALMRKIVGNRMGVKASGGVRDLQTAEQMVAAGANRIGTSAGVRIVTGHSS